MVKHIVIWNLKDEYQDEQKLDQAQKMKDELEALPDFIEGILSLKVYANPLPSSSGDVILVSAFVDQEALTAYQIHPEHRRVAEFIHTVAKERKCMDYIEI